MTRTTASSSSNKTMESKQGKMTKMELKKLKSLLPSLKQKPKSSPIEIVMETIHYIRQLEDQLFDRFQIDVSGQSITSLSDLSYSSVDTSLPVVPFQDIGNSSH